ncbi:MAG: STAS domain-containing protein [Gammaproteobacteria bacterium]|nr:STAS domain-containing protein [Gammaproteobacteria bacterium]
MNDQANNLKLRTDDGRVFISGDITYQTVAHALNVNIFPGEQPSDNQLNVDFSGVGHADSSGLALMLHWLREARARKLDLHFFHIPAKLFALAEMSNLDEVLPIS